MLIIKIDRKSHIPIYKQIVEKIKALIDQFVFKPGDKLPSTRDLAKCLELNRTTVYKAYEELWADGYIESKQGSYSTVRKRNRKTITQNHKKENLINWNKRINLKQEILYYGNNTTKNETEIDFIPLSPDPQLIPKQEFKKCFNEIYKENNNSYFSYGNQYGFKPLREFIAKQMLLHEIKAGTNEILISNGAQNALDLILRLFYKPGFKLAIEKPTYSSALPLFESYNIQLLEIPVNHEGMDLNILEKTFQDKSVNLLYTMPNFQNPTGITTSQAHREKLISLCEKFKVPVIEDGFVEELKYFGKNIHPIKSMDKYGIVFYIGTFSKVLFPGLRLGWIVANNECIYKLSNLKKTIDLSGNTLNQAVVEKFCEKGYYEKHIRKIHNHYKKRMQLALKILRENIINNNISYTKPFGGYTIWFTIKTKNITENQLVNKLKNKGIGISPGSLFYAMQTKDLHFRISIAQTSEKQIEKGLKIISETLNNIQ